jgi:hypothetical protein
MTKEPLTKNMKRAADISYFCGFAGIRYAGCLLIPFRG